MFRIVCITPTIVSTHHYFTKSGIQKLQLIVAMKMAEDQSKTLITKGDIVDFCIVGITLMGQVLSLYTADKTIAKVRCIVDKQEQFFYVEVSSLQPARFPEYYRVA